MVGEWGAYGAQRSSARQWFFIGSRVVWNKNIEAALRLSIMGSKKATCGALYIYFRNTFFGIKRGYGRLTRLFHPVSSGQHCRALVAQSGTLLYRRLATRTAYQIPGVRTTRQTRRIPFCDTADCQSALPVWETCPPSRRVLVPVLWSLSAAVWPLAAQEALFRSFDAARTESQTRSQVESAPYTVRLKDLRLLVSPSLNLEWNDNVRLSEHAPENDFIIRPNLALHAFHPLGEANVISLDLGVGYSKYLVNEELD